MSAVKWTDTYGIHHWRILRSSSRKLAWVRFELTSTEFSSDALTDSAMRPAAQLALSANFVQVLQFHLFVQFARFISVNEFVGFHICFRRNLAQVITWPQYHMSVTSYIIYIYIYIIYIYKYNIYIYIIFNAMLNVYHQRYVVCNLFFLIFFTFYF